MKKIFTIVGALALAGCTTAAHVRGNAGEPLIMIECGAASSLAVCYSRAAKECPSGYRTVSEDSGFNRRTLMVACR